MEMLIGNIQSVSIFGQFANDSHLKMVCSLSSERGGTPLQQSLVSNFSVGGAEIQKGN